MQLLGGIGYTDAYPVERLLRDVRLGLIWTGTSEIMDLIIHYEVYRELGAAPALPEGHRDGAPVSVRRGGVSEVEGPLGREIEEGAEGSGREGIERLKEYRTALILAAVTGKIDVREEVVGGN